MDDDLARRAAQATPEAPEDIGNDDLAQRAKGKTIKTSAGTRAEAAADTDWWSKHATAPLSLTPGAGAIESGVSMVTGFGAKVASDVMGLAATAYDALSGNVDDSDVPGFQRSIQEKYTYQPRSASGQAINQVLGLPGQAVRAVGKPIAKQAGAGAAALGFPEPVASGIERGTQEFVEQAPNLVGGVAPKVIPKIFRKAEPLPPEAPPPKVGTPQEAVNKAYEAEPTSQGAARVPPDISQLPKPFQESVATAARNGPINTEAMDRHIEAQSLPVPIDLREAQATRDAQGFSDEKNMRGDPDTRGVLAESDAKQNAQLVDNIQEIRREATPNAVQRSNVEHGQAAIDEIKTMDNARMDAISGKYKKLADANGGNMPVDGTTWVDNADAALAKANREDYVPGPVRKIMDKVKDAGGEMSFDNFENYRSILADEIRKADRAGDGSTSYAVGLVRKALDDIPMTGPKAAQYRALADDARQAAAARFEDIKRIPAYKAVVNDNVARVNGRHQVGEASPLANNFMDRYFLGSGDAASTANISRTRGIMGKNENFADAIEGSALNKLRDSAGVDANGIGKFQSASYIKARKAMDAKADVLLPKSAEVTQRLSNVSRNINEQPPGSFVNNSSTDIANARRGAQAEAAQARAKGATPFSTAANIGTSALAAKLGPIGGAAKTMGEVFLRNRAAAKAAAQSVAEKEAIAAEKLKWANEVTAPGAGLNKARGASSSVSRP
jgi:hypothetical protein